MFACLHGSGALTALAFQFSPTVEQTAADTVTFDASGLDPATVKRERAVLADKNAGKPAIVLEKIIESGLKTYYKEVCLVDQAYVHDPAKTVAQALKDVAYHADYFHVGVGWIGIGRGA